MTRQYSEEVKRSVAKTISWRMVVIVSDSVVVYALTHKIELALSVMAATNLASIFLYYIHERVWNNIVWGRRRK
jgi:uncharacterized membrane protein